jgi:hypothetical protein
MKEIATWCKYAEIEWCGEWEEPTQPLTHTVPTHVKKREPETTSELQGAGKNVQDKIREHRGVNLAKW